MVDLLDGIETHYGAVAAAVGGIDALAEHADQLQRVREKAKGLAKATQQLQTKLRGIDNEWLEDLQYLRAMCGAGGGIESLRHERGGRVHEGVRRPDPNDGRRAPRQEGGCATVTAASAVSRVGASRGPVQHTLFVTRIFIY